MRDGLPVIALVISVVAFVVALAGIISRGPSEIPEPPEEKLNAAIAQLGQVAQAREAADKEFDRLRKDVVRAIEAGPAGRGGGLDPAEVRDVVKREVDAALRKRLNEEIKRAKAAAKPAAKKAEQAAAKVSEKKKEFDKMVAEIEKTLKLDKKRAGRVRATLTGLREELNRIFRDERAGKIKAPERDARAGAARKKVDVRLAPILGKETFKGFVQWRAASKDAYTRRFFGL